MPLDPTESFRSRHIGPRPTDLDEMLRVVGASSLDRLIDETIPAPIRLEEPLALPGPERESDFLERLHQLAGRNAIAAAARFQEVVAQRGHQGIDQKLSEHGRARE